MTVDPAGLSHALCGEVTEFVSHMFVTCDVSTRGVVEGLYVVRLCVSSSEGSGMSN